jgi:F0F1-type ATP synthase assembly protein I
MMALAPSSNTTLLEIVSWLARVGLVTFVLLGLVAVVFNVTTYFRQKKAAKQAQ